MSDRGTVDRDGFKLEWVREGHGMPMMILGSQSFYRRYYPQSLRDHFEIVFCDLRQWAPTPDGFDVSTITRDVADDATVWYDYTFNSSPLWEGVEINLDVEDQVFAPEVLGDYHLRPLDVPVFLALGRYDYGTPYYMWDEPKKNFSNLHDKLYEKSAHHPPYEQPDEFTADIAEWSKGL